jgi:hypothetical protein
MTHNEHTEPNIKSKPLLEEDDESKVVIVGVGEVEFDAALGLRHGFKVERVTQRQHWFWLSQSSPSFPSLGSPGARTWFATRIGPVSTHQRNLRT